MNVGLVVLGILILVGMFLFNNVIITPQQKAQLSVGNGLCNSPLGTVGSAISGQVAQQCQQASTLSSILSLSTPAYVVGFIIFVAGLAIPSKHKETVIREVVKEPETKMSKSSKSKLFCGNCGAKLRSGAKFCPKCGESV